MWVLSGKGGGMFDLSSGGSKIDNGRGTKKCEKEAR